MYVYVMSVCVLFLLQRLQTRKQMKRSSMLAPASLSSPVTLLHHPYRYVHSTNFTQLHLSKTTLHINHVNITFSQFILDYFKEVGLFTLVENFQKSIGRRRNKTWKGNLSDKKKLPESTGIMILRYKEGEVHRI